MKKGLLLPLILICIISNAQRKYYFEATPGISQYKDQKINPKVGVGFGARLKNFAAGIGVDIDQLNSHSYLPVFIDVKLLPHGRFAPYANVKFGQGFYKEHTSNLQNSTGVFYFGGDVGFSYMDKKGTKFTIAGGVNKAQLQDLNNYGKGRYFVDGYQIYFSIII